MIHAGIAIDAVTALAVHLHAAWLTRAARRADERGQASAEYALVLLGAAAIALLVVGWATRTNKIGQLFDAVVDRIRANVK